MPYFRLVTYSINVYARKDIRKGQSKGKWSIFIKRGHKERASPLPVFSKSIFKEPIKL